VPSTAIASTAPAACVPILNGKQPESVAHQRRIREAMTDPTEAATWLRGYTVGTLAKADVRPLIESFEWLGTIGNATIFVGLFAPQRDLQGAACFGHGPHGPEGGIRDIIGSPALCLERGACTRNAPPNAASYLINAACKLVRDITGTERFFAYADPSGGEYGGVYQAAGWAYLGQGLHGGGYRTERHAVLAPGRDPDDPAQWQVCRALRRHGRRMSFAEAHDAGWLIEMRPAKHVYAFSVGRDRKAWRKGLPELPYPKPRPELTLAARMSRKAGE
jgi:hypothetical protein